MKHKPRNLAKIIPFLSISAIVATTSLFASNTSAAQQNRGEAITSCINSLTNTNTGTLGNNYIVEISPYAAIACRSVRTAQETQYISKCINLVLYTQPDRFGNSNRAEISPYHAAIACQKARTAAASASISSCINSVMYTQTDAFGNRRRTQISPATAVRVCKTR
jgi:hypothetical protein